MRFEILIALAEVPPKVMLCAPRDQGVHLEQGVRARPPVAKHDSTDSRKQ